MKVSYRTLDSLDGRMSIVRTSAKKVRSGVLGV